MTSSAAWDPARTGKRVVFWRHGRTEWNRAGRFQGQQDIALDPSGAHQAVAAAAVLRHLHPDVVISSDLSRALVTAQALGEATGKTVSTDPRLRETFAGAWEGMLFADISAQFPDEQAGWSAGSGDVRAGGGESRVDVGRRVAEAVTEAADALKPGQTLVAVSHGGAIRAGICALLGLPSDSWTVISGVSNCHWSVLEERDASGGGARWNLAQHNVGLDSLPSGPLEG